MKKLLSILMVVLMSATVLAGNRSTSSNLPANTPSVSVTIDGKQKTVKPSHVLISEKDSTHVNVVVSAGKDKASVTLPISYDVVLETIYNTAVLLHSSHLMSDKAYNDCIKWYNRQTGAEF